MSDKLLSIVVLNWNRLAYTKRTIEYLVKKTTVPHILVLVDNHSDQSTGVRDYLLSITKANTNAQEVIHVFNGKNLGVAGGRNSGIYAAEKAGLEPEYLFNIDDDILVPDNYDKQLVEICDKFPKIGLVGINVEPNKYPIIERNGVRAQYKQLGNLNGAALCMPRRSFKIMGYYGFGNGTLYGHEDSFMRYKLDILGLMGIYIPSRGIHLDKDLDLAYRHSKNDAHKKNSIQLRELSRSILIMRKTKNVYTPYVSEEQYHPVDETIFTNELIIKDRK